MKRPSANILLLPAAGLVFAFAPNVMTSVFAVATVVIGSCLFDRVCIGARALCEAAIHRQYVKPPSNLVVIGVVLSVVFVVLGFFWNPLNISVAAVPLKLYVSLLSITGHLLCLGTFVVFLYLLQYAPDFRSSRG